MNYLLRECSNRRKSNSSEQISWLDVELNKTLVQVMIITEFNKQFIVGTVTKIYETTREGIFEVIYTISYRDLCQTVRAFQFHIDWTDIDSSVSCYRNFAAKYAELYVILGAV